MGRKILWLIVFAMIGICMVSFSFGNAYALETKYDNKSGYENKVQYRSLFYEAKPDKIMVQKSGNGNVVQAVVPVNEKEETVEQQGLKND